MDLDVRPAGEGATLRVRVKPRASKSRIVGVRSGMLEVAVQAPPVDGEANAELIRVLGRELGVKRRGISIVSGGGSREKLVRIAMEPSELQRVLEKLGHD